MIKPQKGAKFTKTKNDIQQNQVVTNKEIRNVTFYEIIKS